MAVLIGNVFYIFAEICLIWVFSISTAWCAGTSTSSAQVPSAATLYSSTIKQFVGSGAAVLNNLITPLMEGKSLSTVSGASSFNVNSFQTSGSALLQVKVNLNPSTGDLLNIIVQQDLSNSGSFNYANTFPTTSTGQMISTVCSNGYVQCDPGTNSNCRYRTWSVDGNGAIGVTVTGADGNDQVGNISSLYDCYCFNHYCSNNNNSLADLDSIAASVGGAVLSSYIASNPGMAVSSATSTGLGTISYYGFKVQTPKGSDTSSMTAAQIADMPIISATDASTLQSYYALQAAPTAATDAQQLQTSTSNSLYSIAAGSQSKHSTVTCDNIRNIAVPVVEKTITQTGTTNLSIDDHFVWSFTETAENVFVFTGQDNKGVSFPNTSYTFQPPDTLGGYSLQSVSFAGSWPAGSGDCNNGYSFNPTWTPSVGIGTAIKGSSPVGTCGNYSYQYPIMSWTLTATYKTQSLSESIVNGCQQYEKSDSPCKLQQETDDGKLVVSDYNSTGFKIVSQPCQTITGDLSAVKVCRSWFKQHKTYTCPSTATKYDFNSLQQRVKGVQDSTTMPTSSTMSYTDQAGQHTYNVPPQGTLPSCSQICQTKIPVPQSPITYNQAPASANLTALGVAAASYEFFYKDCNDDGSGSSTCPIDVSKGETVVTSCACAGDFGNAVSALSAVNSSAQDSICAAQ
jgi:hypothetical protein